MSKKVAYVTGGMGGIGTSICQRLHKDGFKVIAGCGPSRDHTKWIGEQAELGYTFHASAGNVADWESTAVAFSKAVAEHGPIEVLVNNAGITRDRMFLKMSPEDWKAVIDTNLNGTWYMMHAMARRWQGTGTRGNIVNIVATFQRGMPGVAHTCAARAAVTHLSKTVAVEWAQHGIRVNCIAPGAIASTGFRQYSPEAVKAFAGANPMKHVGDVQDVAEAAVYLSAPSGKFVTGELLTVDGGGVLWGEVWTIAKPDYFKVNT